MKPNTNANFQIITANSRASEYNEEAKISIQILRALLKFMYWFVVGVFFSRILFQKRKNALEIENDENKKESKKANDEERGERERERGKEACKMRESNCEFELVVMC